MRSKLKLIVFFLFLILPLFFGVSQLPAPIYYQYEVEGQIINENSNGRLKNLTVVLLGKQIGGRNWLPLHEYTFSNTDLPNLPVALSDSSGKFLVRIAPTFDKLDSIIPAIVVGEKSYELGSAIYVNQNDAKKMTNNYIYSNESGCSCENTTSNETKISGYVFTYKEKKIRTQQF
jgi:hypothetical protein